MVQNQYVLINGKPHHKDIVKEVKTGLVQAGVQETQYEVDWEKVMDRLVEFGGMN